MKCYRCGCSVESGRSFIPIDPSGTEGRRWTCVVCANKDQKQKARESLGKAGLEITRIFDPKFLR